MDRLRWRASCVKQASPGKTILGALLVASLLGGCSLLQPGARPQSSAPSPAVFPEAAELSEAISERHDELARFRGQARLDYQGVDNRVRASQMIVVRDTDDIRIDVLNPFGVSYSVVNVGGRLQAYDRREKVFYTGSSSPASIERLAGVRLSAPLLAALLRGLPPRVAPDSSMMVEEGAEQHVLRVDDSQGGRVTVSFGRLDRLPSSFTWSDAAGDAWLEASFSDYRPISDGVVAHRIEVSFSDGATLVLRYDHVWTDVAVGEHTFSIRAPASADWIDIDSVVTPG